uniref:Histamine N-methyltransferase n=1 Tax=Sparus aurata TaxID=8175 RepID=A0A671XV34_SPAAU
MSSPLNSLVNDDGRYQESFELFLERSSEHQCMRDFIHSLLPDILGSIGNGKSHLNVIGVGSGAGEIDLEMLSQLRLKHPGVTVDNEVVEPSGQQLHNYRVLVSKKPELDWVQFHWNKMTAAEFEAQWKEKKMSKKVDFIHMIQMLYYVKDPGATVSFFQSLLDKNGKLVIILVSGESGWGKLWKTHRRQLCNTEISQCVTTGDIKSFLDSEGVSYQSYILPSQLDITECFTVGDEKGELLLDFLTEVLDFTAGESAVQPKFIMRSYVRHAQGRAAGQTVGGERATLPNLKRREGGEGEQPTLCLSSPHTQGIRHGCRNKADLL